MTDLNTLLPRTWLWIALLAFIMWMIQKAKRYSWFFAFLVLPGTFCHEASHYFAALLLNGKPVGFSLWPRRSCNQLVLGSVRISNQRWYNVFFIGMAPLCLFYAAYHLFMWMQARRLDLGWPVFLLLFLVANLAYGALPSSQDIKVSAKSPVGWVILGVLLTYGWMQWH